MTGKRSDAMGYTYMGQLLLVGLGGFIGSALRFAISGGVQRLFPYSQFPFGTLAVNVLGCLCIGFLGGIGQQRGALDTGAHLLLVAGLLGGFTTFSSFAYESLALAQDSQFLKAMLNVVLQVVVGFSAAWAGLMLARLT